MEDIINDYYIIFDTIKNKISVRKKIDASVSQFFQARIVA